MNSVPPIIVVGMHRSGTSVLTRTLEKAGLFLGDKKDGNDEALFFLQLNELVFRMSGARWENPASLEYLMSDPVSMELVKKFVERRMGQPACAGYLGFKKYFRYRSIHNIPFLWGWKDPRNMFTIPIWLEIFPEAKIIMIDRHGVDVADSLFQRNRLDQAAKLKWAGFRSSVFSSKSEMEKLIPHPRCASLSTSFEVWQEYMEQSENIARIVENERLMRFKYEDFLYNPILILSRLFAFCNLSEDKKLINAISSDLDRGRAYAYRSDASLVRFSKSVSPQLERFGYSASD